MLHFRMQMALRGNAWAIWFCSLTIEFERAALTSVELPASHSGMRNSIYLAVVRAVSAVRAAVGIASCIEFRRACLADEISMEGMIPAQNERWRRG